MRVNRSRLAKLKEEIKLNNKQTYIQHVHTQKEIASTNERCGRIEDQLVTDLGTQLETLQKQILLEEFVHQAASDYFRKAQGEMQDLTISWGERGRVDSDLKEAEIEVS